MRKHTISFKNALIGIYTATRTQANIRIHLIVSAVVFLSAVYFHITLREAIDLVIAVSLVIVAEMFNTSIEFLSDAVTKENNQLIKYTKDVAAGAVLLSAIFAAIIGLIVFGPKVL